MLGRTDGRTFFCSSSSGIFATAMAMSALHLDARCCCSSIREAQSVRARSTEARRSRTCVVFTALVSPGPAPAGVISPFADTNAFAGTNGASLVCTACKKGGRTCTCAILALSLSSKSAHSRLRSISARHSRTLPLKASPRALASAHALTHLSSTLLRPPSRGSDSSWDASPRKGAASAGKRMRVLARE